MAKSGVGAIIEEFKELEKRDQSRNASYDEVLTFYGGTTLKQAKKQGYLSGIAQNISSIFSPKSQDEDAELITPINIVKPAIENKVAFLALPPTIRVVEPPDKFAPNATPEGGPGMPGNDPEAMGQLPAEPGAPPMGPPPTPQVDGQPQAPGAMDEDWGTDFADRLERVIESLLAFSNMPARCRDVAWSMCAMDGAVIGAWPDLRHGRPRIFTRTPQDFYPVAYDEDGLDLRKAMWKETLSGRDVAAKYPGPGEKFIDADEVSVIKCIDEEKFYTILDEEVFAHPPMENKMEVVPIVCVSALGLPGMIFGSTDIKDAIPVAREINYHMHLVEEMASAMIRPTIAIKDPLEVPAEVAIGRGGTITMGPSGSVELLGPIALPQAFWSLSTQLENWFNLIADNPQALRAEDGGGMTTGAGFNAKLGPIAARMQQRLEILMAAWRQAIKYMLMMWEKFPGMKGVSAAGMKDKETFYLEAEPSEFLIDGKMWTEMEVFLQAQSFIDRQGNAVEIMQLYQNELIDWDTAVDNLQQVTDKKRTRARIDKDRQWKAAGMAMSQQAMESPMTANVPLAAQEKTNYGLERGFMGETPSMPKPVATGYDEAAGGMPGMGGPEMGMPMGPEGEDMVGVLREFFESIDRLRGSVWFGGDPVLNPEALAGDDWSVTVWVTDPADKGTITRAAENVEVVYGHIKFIVGTPSPDEQAIQVAGGPQEEEPPEEEMLGEEMPPEMGEGMGGGGMMGGMDEMMGGM